LFGFVPADSELQAAKIGQSYIATTPDNAL